jgi:NAD(P)-dependent dehydrogenase (short-subunit alcohol dehydrogenase family)
MSSVNETAAPIVVTGGNRGIAGAIAERLGARAVVWSRSHNGVDVTDVASVQRATDDLLRTRGAPFGLVHGVGCFDEIPLLSTTDAQFRELLDSNFTSAFLVMRALVPAMCDVGRGRVIFFSAAGAEDRTAKTRAPVYFAAKAALTSLARSLAKEVAPRGVRVNVIAPGIIAHPHSHAPSQARMAARIPSGRVGSIADLLGAVELLLSDRGDYVTGDVWTIDGGLALG